MSKKFLLLEYGNYYHIYNQGINGERLFREKNDYELFLELYFKYIPIIASTFAWSLLGNHFHCLVKIKHEDEIDYLPPKETGNHLSIMKKEDDKKRKPIPSKQFSHTFNAFTRRINNKYERYGSLFIRPYRRIQVKNTRYLANLVQYIHFNPVLHGFVDDIEDYTWTSYHTILSSNPTKLERDELIEWFKTKNKFKEYHMQEQEWEHIQDMIID